MAKIGQGSFGAWMRLGLRELRAVFFPESNVAQPSEYGIFGTLTPGEVAAGRRDAPAVPSPGRSPAAIAAAHAHGGHGGEPQRSPSEIAAQAHSGHGPEQSHGHGHEFGHGHEHEMGHGI
jgi:hypothetical protein